MTAAFTDKDVPSQVGKTIVITGANTGIGFEVAKVLAGKGARVYIGCRSGEKASKAIAQLHTVHENADVHYVHLDLGDLSSVKSCAEQLQAEPSIDVLINNAGIMAPPYQRTVDGFESQIGVNFLGHFALTGLLLDKLNAAPTARVVTNSSHAHYFGKIDFEDIHAEEKYDPNARYAMTKLCNVVFAYELQRRLAAAGHSTISVACHPGVAATELLREPPSYAKLIQPIVRRFVNTSAGGAWPTLCAATSPGVQGGDYYGPSRFGQTSGPARRVKSARGSHDRELARRLWDMAMTMTGENFLAE